MHRGYIKLWRKTLDSGLLCNPQVFTLFAWAIMKASHKDCKQMVGGGVVELRTGQFVTGIHAAATELKTTPRKVRTAITTLERLGYITRKSTNKFSIITIVKWDTYQQSDNPDDKQVTSKRQASDNKQELKNLRSKEHGDFDQFWKAYPKKKSKQSALKAWKKNKPDLQTCLNALEVQKRSEDWTKDNGQFIPYPATWINAGGWDDEVEGQETTTTDSLQGILDQC